jgi:hypothetical protein
MRALAQWLPARQNWRLVDNDEALLAKAFVGTADAAPTGAKAAAVNVTAVATDLAGVIGPVLGDCDLVTTSALLDLVSSAWLDRLVEALARRPRPFYAALSYDGTVALLPDSRLDVEMIVAVNRHQRTDKGFGPALGPDAARIAPEWLRDAGFTVIEGRSDWLFGADDVAIQMEMLAGWAGAARDIGVNAAIVAKWLGERRGHVSAGRSQIRVGHIDFFAVPTVRR